MTKKRVRKRKPVKAWGLQRDTGALIGTWVSLGNGYDGVGAALMLKKAHAAALAKKFPNSRERLKIVRVLITVEPQS
jgi:hypothetical protein